MSKFVYLDMNSAGKMYVREIIPTECIPIAEWYNEEFASHCVEAPDDVVPNMIYDKGSDSFTFPTMTDEVSEYSPIEEILNAFLG